MQETLDALVKKHLVLERSGFGSRVPKYQHRFCNTGFGTLEFTPLETAILCELLLRGPQTPGELRGRANRMAPIAEVGEVEAALSRLAAREDGPFVVRLAREPGQAGFPICPPVQRLGRRRSGRHRAIPRPRRRPPRRGSTCRART